MGYYRIWTVDDSLQPVGIAHTQSTEPTDAEIAEWAGNYGGAVQAMDSLGRSVWWDCGAGSRPTLKAALQAVEDAVQAVMLS